MSKFDSNPKGFTWRDLSKYFNSPIPSTFMPPNAEQPNQAVERKRRIERAIQDWASPESALSYQFESVDVACATLPKYKRPGNNGDRIVVLATRGKNGQERICAAGVDGMGGHENPGDAAQALAENIASQVINAEDTSVDRGTFKKVQSEAAQAVLEFSDNSGAVYSAVVIENRHLREYHAGDCRVLVVRDGVLLNATQDEGYLNALHNAVKSGYPGSTSSAIDMDLRPGDIVLILSDGVTDNIGEPYKNIIKAHVDGKLTRKMLDDDTKAVNEKLAQITKRGNVKEIVQAIGSLVITNMAESGRKPDDFGLVAIRIK